MTHTSVRLPTVLSIDTNQLGLHRYELIFNILFITVLKELLLPRPVVLVVGAEPCRRYERLGKTSLLSPG